MLQTRALEQYYGGSHILWDINFTVQEGSCTCLMGRNGVGKTTLLKTILGVVPARSGEVSFRAKSLLGAPPEARARLGIGYVPQGREIFSQLSVEENLRTGLVARKDGRSQIPDLVYELFPVLKSMLRRRGGDLSGGQQQQLAIARALVSEPSLLILDEPTEGIQPNVVREIGDVIQKLNRERGLTVLLVEQKLPFARRVADRFCLMQKGRIVADGSMDEMDDQLVASHLSV